MILSLLFCVVKFLKGRVCTMKDFSSLVFRKRANRLLKYGLFCLFIHYIARIIIYDVSTFSPFTILSLCEFWNRMNLLLTSNAEWYYVLRCFVAAQIVIVTKTKIYVVKMITKRNNEWDLSWIWIICIRGRSHSQSISVHTNISHERNT